MQRDDQASLRDSVISAGSLSALVSESSEKGASWREFIDGVVLSQSLAELSGRTVVLATSDQFPAAAALVWLDGVARRIVLCPPDLSRAHLLYVAECAGANLIVTDQSGFESIGPRVSWSVLDAGKAPRIKAGLYQHSREYKVETEWILLTSGTTGHPKLVAHTLASLAGAIERRVDTAASRVWSTFYDIRRYGGLQIFLRAAITGTSLVLKGVRESTADFLERAGSAGVTHISGTPTQWRQALMSPSSSNIVPKYVRLSGEIADQTILNNLHERYPQARISHAFASTEAGVAFEVNDGRMGFPSELLDHSPNVKMKVEGETLRVSSKRIAFRYLNKDSQPIRDAEGFVDTGDTLELRDGRYYFVGRRDGTVNVGGLKVHPEEVEAVLNRHPEVSISLVRTKKNRITGSLVVADVVLRTPPQPGCSETTELQSDILQFCRGKLARHKVPAAINFVPTLAVAQSGKLVRTLA